jgi:hypothetical protein
MTAPTNGQRAATATDPEHPARFKVIVYKTASSQPSAHAYTDPIEALVAAVEYLKRGYHVKLHDHVVAYFDKAPGLPVAPVFRAASEGTS